MIMLNEPGDTALKTSKMLQASVAAALLCAASAQATTIDFDAATVTSQLTSNAFYLGYVAKTYTEEGFVFSSTGPVGNRVVAPYLTYNNNSFALGESLFGTTTLTTADNSLFSISSLDLIRLPLLFNTTITFTGTKASGPDAVQTFKFTNNHWNSISFNSSFTNLTSLKWSQGITNFAVDNLNVTAVPEPATYAMLLGGLGLIGLARRRKQA